VRQQRLTPYKKNYDARALAENSEVVPTWCPEECEVDATSLIGTLEEYEAAMAAAGL